MPSRDKDDRPSPQMPLRVGDYEPPGLVRLGTVQELTESEEFSFLSVIIRPTTTYCGTGGCGIRG